MGKHKYEYGKGGGKGKGAQALFDKLKSMGYKKAGGGVGDEIRQVMMKRGGMYKCGTPKLLTKKMMGGASMYPNDMKMMKKAGEMPATKVNNSYKMGGWTHSGKK